MSIVTTRFLIRAGILIAFLTVVEFWPVLQGKTPLPIDKLNRYPVYDSVFGDRYANHPAGADNGDLVTQIFQWRSFGAAAVREGTLPLWNPHILTGTPFIANGQSALFYPPNALFLLVPIHIAWSLTLMLHVALAGLFAAVYARSVGMTDRGAAFSGVVYAFCGFLAVWRGYPMGDAAVWLPLTLWCVDRLRAEPSWRHIGLTAVALSMPLLAGHPETAAHIVLVGAAYALYRLRGFNPGRFAAAFMISGVAAVALAAIQVLPTLEWIDYVPLSEKQVWPARPLHELVAFFSRDLLASPNAAQVYIPEGAAYVGMITLLLAAWAYVGRNRGIIVFWSLAIVLSAVVAYGIEPLFGAFSSIPVLGSLKNHRLLLVVDFGLAILAGFGVSIAAGSPDRAHRFRQWVALSVATAICICGIYVMRTLTVANAGRLRSPSSSAVLLLAGFVLLAARSAGRLSYRRFSYACIGLVSLDLISASHRYLPMANTDEIFPSAPAFRFLQQNIGSGYRVAAVDLTYGANAEMTYGLSSVAGYDVPLTRSLRMLADYIGDPAGINLVGDRIGGNQDRRLDLLGVRYLVTTTHHGNDEKLQNIGSDRFSPVFSDGVVRVYENRRALERAWFVPGSGVEVIADEPNQLKRVSEDMFDPRQTVVLDKAVTFQAGTSAERRAAGVHDFAQSTNDIQIRADVDTPGVLIISETNYPGWHASVDGRSVPILATDYVLMGIALEPGSHTITLRYSPCSFWWGLGISAFAWSFLIVLPAASTASARYRRHTGAF